MPNDNDNLENMSIEQINELFEDVIEIPDEYKLSSQGMNYKDLNGGPRGWGCS